MNASREVISVSELRKILLEIDACDREVDVHFVNGDPGKNPCTMEQMCNVCIDKFAGLLEWAEDLEDVPQVLS